MKNSKTTTANDKKNRCSKWSYSDDHWPHPCVGKLKNDEQRESGLCGRHLAGRRRREANSEKHRARQRANQARRDKARRACERLASFGIKAEVHYNAFQKIDDGYTGRVVIRDPAALLRKLEAGRKPDDRRETGDSK